MHTLRRGFLAGVLASLVLAMFDFVTVGAPGNGFPAVLRWFGLTICRPHDQPLGRLSAPPRAGWSLWSHLWGTPEGQVYHHWSCALHRAGARRALVAPL